MRLKQIDSEGFTLLEVVISLAIATFIIGGIVMFSVNSLKANMKSQAMQETMDNARFAIDDLAKKVRTSSNVVLSADEKSLFFVDNLTSTKYCYEFKDDKMTMKSFELQIGEPNNLMLNEEEYRSVVDCSSDNFSKVNIGGGGPPVELIGNSKTTISGNFKVLKTEVNTNNPHRGFVRIIVDIAYKKGLTSDDPSDSAEAYIQTGVSVLDYTRESGVF